MSCFIKMQTLAGWKAASRKIYPTYAEAKVEVNRLNRTQCNVFAVGDADHEPDKSILLYRHGLS